MYRARKYLLKNPEGKYDDYLYYTEDHSMQQTVFEIARHETPEERKNAINAALFNKGAIATDIPETRGPPPPEPAGTPIEEPPRPQPAPRIITGTLPPKFRPVEQAPLPPTPLQENTMAKSKAWTRAGARMTESKTRSDGRIMTTGPARGPKPSKESTDIFDSLKASYSKSGTIATYTDFQAEVGKVEKNVYASARQKLIRHIEKGLVEKVGKSNGHAAASRPAAAIASSGVVGAKRYEQLYESDKPPSTAVLAELKVLVPAILTAILGSGSSIQFLVHSEGFEVRRAIH